MTTPVKYDPLIPQRNDTIAISQSNFLDNFRDLYDAFAENHTPLDDATNPGNHEVIELVEQQTKLNTEVNEIAVYTKKVDGQTDQLFMRYGANGKEFQVTNWQIYSIEQTPTQKAFFSFLPGGIIVYFGTIFTNNATTAFITLNPGVRNNIMGVNLGGIATIAAQPNVALVAPINGIHNTIILNSPSAMPDQFYMVFANL